MVPSRLITFIAGLPLPYLYGILSNRRHGRQTLSGEKYTMSFLFCPLHLVCRLLFFTNGYNIYFLKKREKTGTFFPLSGLFGWYKGQSVIYFVTNFGKSPDWPLFVPAGGVPICKIESLWPWAVVWTAPPPPGCFSRRAWISDIFTSPKKGPHCKLNVMRWVMIEI